MLESRFITGIPRDSCLGVCEGGRVRQGEDPGHTNQSLLLGGVFALIQWGRSREMSCQGRDLCSCKLGGRDGLCRRASRGTLGARRGSRGGTRSRGLLLLPFVARGNSSESFRSGGERKDTRDVDQLLDSGANAEKEIRVRRSALGGRCEESVGNGVRGECQDARCQGIGVDVWNRAPLGHQPRKPGVDIFQGSDGGTQIITKAFFSRLETNGPCRLVSDPRREVHCHTLTAHWRSRRRGGLRGWGWARRLILGVRGPKEAPRGGSAERWVLDDWAKGEEL